MMTKVEAWCVFSEQVKKHIEETEHGHYSQGGIDVIDFIESQFGNWANIAWAKDAIKYIVRLPHTDNHVDVLKAAHYLCRIYTVLAGEDNEKVAFTPRDKPFAKCYAANDPKTLRQQTPE